MESDRVCKEQQGSSRAPVRMGPRCLRWGWAKRRMEGREASPVLDREGRNCKGMRMGKVGTPGREEAVSKLRPWTHHQPGLRASHTVGRPRPTQHYPCGHFQESQSLLDIFS